MLDTLHQANLRCFYMLFIFVKLLMNKLNSIGINVFEVHQTFSEWLSQIVRIYKDSVDIEFEWLIDSIPITYVNLQL